MEGASRQDATLTEAANIFLASLPPEDKEKAQIEVYNFVRWLGLSRKASGLNPLDIEEYAEQITPSAAAPVRSFLSYIHKKGFTGVSLASHLRVKKPSSKTAAPAQQPKIPSTLSAEGYARLKAELASLKSQRSEVTREIHRAAEDKDFSENVPFQAAREHKSHLEGRIQELELILKSARLIGETESTAQVKIGNAVKLRDLSSGKELRYTLVDPREADPARGMISIASPLGKALLDKQKGKTVTVTAPAGTFSYRVEDIEQV
jgi:transcription elongation factor GreA